MREGDWLEVSSLFYFLYRFKKSLKLSPTKSRKPKLKLLNLTFSFFNVCTLSRPKTRVAVLLKDWQMSMNIMVELC